MVVLKLGFRTKFDGFCFYKHENEADKNKKAGASKETPARIEYAELLHWNWLQPNFQSFLIEIVKQHESWFKCSYVLV